MARLALRPLKASGTTYLRATVPFSEQPAAGWHSSGGGSFCWVGYVIARRTLVHTTQHRAIVSHLLASRKQAPVRFLSQSFPIVAKR